MAWILTPALTTLRSNFNARFPNRDKTTDGTIGDWEHQQHVSSHNPDDTVGSMSEYSDSDTIAEVRAIDIDKDLGDPHVTMQDVVDKILATPEDLKRLRYIIYNRTIWAKSNGWDPVPYDGVSPHTEHVHLNGDPNYDNANANWSVLEVGMADLAPHEIVNAIANGSIDKGYITGKETAGTPGFGLNVTDYNLRNLSAQARANGNSLSSLTAAVAALSSALSDLAAKVEALQLGGVNEDTLRQIVEDGVRAQLNATRFTNG